MRTSLITLIVLSSLLGAAPVRAQAKANPTANKTRQPEVRKPGGTIYFRAPSNGSRVAPTFEVAFGLKNYGVAPAGTKVPNTGHFHILIDRDAPAVGSVLPSNGNTLHYGGGQIETRLTLPPGRHRLILVLADGEHRVISEDLITTPIEITVTRK